MPRCNSIFHGLARLLVATAVTILTCGTAWAQTALENRLIEFLPSDRDTATLADGQPAVTQYDVEITVAGTTQVLQRVSIGKPVVAADGMIRVNVASQLTAIPVAGVQYLARVLAVGPSGTTVSIASNPFSFNRCSYQLAAPDGSLPAAGGSGSVEVVSGGSCNWTAVSSAPWLTVMTGTVGAGKGSVAYGAKANSGATSRVATLSVGTETYAVTQAGAAPQTVLVATEPELQAAIAALASNTTILIAPGNYRLTKTLRVAGNLTGVVLRGGTGNAADIVIEGTGLSADSEAPTAISVSGRVQDLQIADLTIRRFSAYGILFSEGPQAPRLSNLRLSDTGRAMIEVISGIAGVNDGLVEQSTLEYTMAGAGAAGVDLQGASRWTIRRSSFRNVRASAGEIAHAAVSASAGSTETTVEENVFFNCQNGIALGLKDVEGGFDHKGGRVTNNFFYRGPKIPGGPGISIVDSPGTQVGNNTVITSGTYPSPIEYRFAGTTDLVVANNLVDGAIRARDGAWAIETGNVTNAVPDMFVDAVAGDLHLRASAVDAIGAGDASTAEPKDIDGNIRAVGKAPDAGADERDPTTDPQVEVTTAAP